MICIEIPRSDKQGESNIDDDDVHYYIGERLKLKGETENMGVCTKERKGVIARYALTEVSQVVSSLP